MSNLITNQEVEPPDTILIVGNGAIKGGNEIVWQTVAQLEQYKMYAGIDEAYKLSNPDPSTYLATLAHIARDNRYTMLKIISERGELGVDRGWFEPGVNYFEEFRTKLGAAFVQAKADRKIELRDALPIFRYLKPKESFGTISINWDEILLTSPPFNRQLISLHGRASHSKTLILPMETSTDDHFIDLVTKANPAIEKSKDFDLVQQAFREKSVREDHDHVHNVAQGWLLNAKRIIIWGVAFNAYDAELISLIPKDSRHRDLVIINPDSRARDVAGTILCNNPKRRIDFNPVRSEEIVKK
jgi:hypothetical protein